MKVPSFRRQGVGILDNVSEQESGFCLTLNQNIVDRGVSASRFLRHWLSRLVFTTVCGAKNREAVLHPKGHYGHMFLKLQERVRYALVVGVRHVVAFCGCSTGSSHLNVALEVKSRGFTWEANQGGERG